MVKKDKEAGNYYGFDPSGLERAATVTFYLPLYSLGCKILGLKSKCEGGF